MKRRNYTLEEYTERIKDAEYDEITESKKIKKTIRLMFNQLIEEGHTEISVDKVIYKLANEFKIIRITKYHIFSLDQMNIVEVTIIVFLAIIIFIMIFNREKLFKGGGYKTYHNIYESEDNVTVPPSLHFQPEINITNERNRMLRLQINSYFCTRLQPPKDKTHENVNRENKHCTRRHL